MRWTISVDPTITDADEKEHALRLLVDDGEGAVAPLTSFLHQQ